MYAGTHDAAYIRIGTALELLKCDPVSAVIKANLKLIKDDAAPENVKTNAKAFRKSDGCNHFLGVNMNREIVCGGDDGHDLHFGKSCTRKVEIYFTRDVRSVT